MVAVSLASAACKKTDPGKASAGSGTASTAGSGSGSGSAAQGSATAPAPVAADKLEGQLDLIAWPGYIERGETVSGPLRETNVFPSMVVQMINVGETTGALDAMLSKIADFYEEEVDTAVAGLLTLMEPIMIAVLGGVVGGIVIAMYMPIFDLISKMT